MKPLLTINTELQKPRLPIIPKGQILRPSQVEAVQLMDDFLNRPLLVDKPVKGIFNGSDMGTGKSPSTIASLNTQKAFRNIFIVPSSVKYNWAKEIEKWSTHERKTILICDEGRDLQKASDFNFIITSPGLLHRVDLLYYLYRVPIHSLVIDESTVIKNPRSAAAKTIRKYLASRVKHIYCLSGTGLLKNLQDLWTPFSFIDPLFFGDRTEFLNKYSYSYGINLTKQLPNGEIRTHRAIEYTGSREEEELAEFIGSRFYLRYSLEDVAPELPPMSWLEVSVPDKDLKKDKENREAIDEYERWCRGDIPDLDLDNLSDTETILAMSKMSLTKAKVLNKAKKATAHERLPYILNYAKELVDTGQSIIIFAYHLDMIREIEEFFKSKKVKTGTITGDVESKERQNIVDRFQALEFPVFIGQIKACSEGLNLTAASAVLMAELDWAQGKNQQAAKRAHRIGQTRPVIIYYFTSDTSADKNLLRNLAGKAELSNKVLGTDLPTFREDMEVGFACTRKEALRKVEATIAEHPGYTTEEIAQITGPIKIKTFNNLKKGINTL